MKNRYWLILVALIAVIAIWYFIFGSQATAPSAPPEDDFPTNLLSDEGQANNSSQSTSQYSIDEPDSIWLVVNKQRPIDTNYVPVDLVDVDVLKRTDKSEEELMLRQEAANSLINMFSEANKDGVVLMMGSAYRSATLQESYYSNYVNTYGQQEADKFSAKPGTSEHQTGLAADLATADKTCYLEICFKVTPEGQWIANNAHKYGFIVRYLEGKESITGYQYEPWHIRYVGLNLAAQLYESGLTMEEHFEL